MKLNSSKEVRNIVFSVLLTGLVFLSGFFSLFPGRVEGDGGWSPYFDDFSIYESGQKAIIAWDGTEEILILSVDVHGAGDNKALHFVPLPSIPTFQLGNTTAFTEINELIYLRGHYSDGEGEAEAEAEGEGDSGIKIEFHEIIGSHDLTVVRFNTSKEFTQWVIKFLNGKGVENVSFLKGTEKVVKHYIDQNINYFVFDVIDINETERTVQPVIYRFKSDCIYYPLVISSIIEGVSEINVVTLTPAELPINLEDFTDIGFNRHIGFRITHKELEKISPEISELIQTDAYLNFFEDLFPLKELNQDVKSEVLTNVNWMKTVYDTVQYPIYYDCNGNDIDDLIFYSEPSYYMDFEWSEMQTKPRLFAINSIDGSELWTNNLSINLNYTNIWVNYLETRLDDINGDGINEVLAFLEIHNEYYDYSIDWEWVYYTFYRVIAIDSRTGNTIWMYNTSHGYDYEFSYHSPTICDVDIDGKLEIIIFSSGEKWQYSDGWTSVEVLNLEDGSKLWNSSVETDRQYLFDLIVLDINKDSDQEIILRTVDKLLCINGKTGEIIWNKDVYENEFSKSSNYKLLESIHDFNLDGDLEIFIVSDNRRLTLFNGSTGLVIWEVWIPYFPSSSRGNGNNNGWWKSGSLGYYDIDYDGILEVLYFSYEGIFVFHSNNGTLVWDLTIPFVDEFDLDYYYYYYPWWDDYWNFEICDANQDNNLEIICTFNCRIYTINLENGTILWNKTIELENYYSWIPGYLIEDVDNDKMVEIIFSVDGDIYALNGEDGTTKWQFVNSKELQIISQFIDIKNDGSQCLLLYHDYKVSLLDCSDGSMDWSFHTKKYGYLIFGGLDDIDHDGINELILFDKIRMYVLDPSTGNEIWKFTTGDRVNSYFNFNKDSGIDQNIILFCTDKIYSVNKLQMYLALTINPVTVQPGDSVNFTVHVGYSDTPIHGVDFILSDDNLDGNFSKITELFPGVYKFDYTVPNTNRNYISISIFAHHPKYYDKTEVVQLNIVDNSSSLKQQKSPLGNSQVHDKDLLKVISTAIPENLKPGNSTMVLFKIIGNNSIITTNLNISLFDNNLNGHFSSVEFYSADYQYFIYTVPKNITINSIPLLILVCHEDYHDGFGIINLKIDLNESEDGEQDEEPEQSIIIEPLDDKLSITVTPFPHKLKPGDSTVILTQINANNKPIMSADIQATDNNVGGLISNFIEYGGGHYTFIYEVPSDIPEYLQSITLFIVITHENYTIHFELIELVIDHIHEEKTINEVTDIDLKLFAHPNQLCFGETTTIVVSITGNLSNLDTLNLSNFKIELSDHGHGGEFCIIEIHDPGRYIYTYKIHQSSASFIEISVSLYYEDTEIADNSINLEISNPSNSEEKPVVREKSKSITDHLLIILPILIFIFIICIIFRKSIRLKLNSNKGKKTENKNELEKTISEKNTQNGS